MSQPLHFWPNKNQLERVKPEVKKGHQAIHGFPGRCLFVTGNDGETCQASVVKGHVITEGTVLEKLKDVPSGKVMELRWGANQWQHLLSSSDEEHPLNFQDPLIYKPPRLGKGDACTGRFSCLEHDQVFGKYIDPENRNLKDPKVLFLIMFRSVLFYRYLTDMADSVIDQFQVGVMRSNDVGLRMTWVTNKQDLTSVTQWIQPLSIEMSKNWYRNEGTQVWPSEAVLTDDLEFRSKLRFAASIIYHTNKGHLISITVLPLEQDRHRMLVVIPPSETVLVQPVLRPLVEMAVDSLREPGIGIQLLHNLMSQGTGIAAADPNSYEELNDSDRRTINGAVVPTMLSRKMYDWASRNSKQGERTSTKGRKKYGKR